MKKKKKGTQIQTDVDADADATFSPIQTAPWSNYLPLSLFFLNELSFSRSFSPSKQTVRKSSKKSKATDEKKKIVIVKY